jgi:hypothetical protein
MNSVSVVDAGWNELCSVVEAGWNELCFCGAGRLE